MMIDYVAASIPRKQTKNVSGMALQRAHQGTADTANDLLMPDWIVQDLCLNKFTSVQACLLVFSWWERSAATATGPTHRP